MINFRTVIPDSESLSLVCLDLFISSEANIFSTMAFRPLETFHHVAVSVSIDFLPNSKGDAPFTV